MNDKTSYLCDICKVIIRLKNDNKNPGIISGIVKIEEVNKPDEKQIKDYEVPVPPKWDMMDICKIYLLYLFFRYFGWECRRIFYVGRFYRIYL